MEMNRFLKYMVFTVSLVLIFTIPASCSKQTEKIEVLPFETRPNIIIIFADDLDEKLGTTQYMPNLKTYLADYGVTVEDFLITTPMCCPSRINLFRSQHTHNHEVFNNSAPNGGFPKFFESGKEASTLPVWLQAAGYRTALIGKYLNAYPLTDNRTYIPPGWSEWYSPGRKNAYDGFDYYLNENGELVPYPPSQENFFTDVMSRKGVDFIKRASQDDVSFFLFLAPFAPHEPSAAAPRHENLLPDISAPRLPSFNEEDVSDKSPNMRSNPSLSDGDIAGIDTRYRERVLSMLSVDEMIPELIKTLEENGELENTYIIFTSDQGFTLGEHRIVEGKSSLYEENMVVPFIIRGPGIPQNETVNGMLSSIIDIAPTISEWAGVVPPVFIDGSSFASIVQRAEPTQNWRNALLLEVYSFKGSEEGAIFPDLSASLLPFKMKLDGGVPKSAGLRTMKYSYMEISDGFVELYDLQSDPYQLENLAPVTSPEILLSFSDLLHKLETCKAEECRALEMEIVP